MTYKGSIMHIFEILLWILGSLAALLALGKIRHEKRSKDSHVCSCCGQSLPPQKQQTHKAL